MSYLNEKVAYLKGLAEGMEVETASKEGKLLVHIIDLLEDFADSIEEVDMELEELDEYVEAIDEDLTDLENDVYEDDDFDGDFDDSNKFEEIECPTCGEQLFVEEDFLCDDDNCEVKIECPNCQETIYITEDDEDFEDDEQ